MKPRCRDWFFPGDTPLDTARELCRRYRAELYAADPDRCATVDDTARQLGQDWAVPELAVVDPDSLMSPADLAGYLHVSVAVINRWSSKGLIRSFPNPPGRRVLHRLGDALDYQADLRRNRMRRRTQTG